MGELFWISVELLDEWYGARFSGGFVSGAKGDGAIGVFWMLLALIPMADLGSMFLFLQTNCSAKINIFIQTSK